ncbi:hypothetical protein Clacol_003131 [Clathrus columnatus]|uniref:Uncharacterized protein n=1 Tax=Clathrus columnatus TaxID=1419009 RepID=A0AAV5A2M4_9AGAM|nr:hypothetical protein Clacol_003131 [Clathrus columnatus]
MLSYTLAKGPEPADAREALLKYYLAKKCKTTQPKPNPNYLMRSKTKLPSLASSTSSSSSSVSSVFSSCSSPSSISSPDTSPCSSPRPSTVSDSEDREEKPFGEMYIDANNEDIWQLSIYDYAPIRPTHLEYNILWLGVEADVEFVFSSWESGLGYIPDACVHDAIRTFEAGAVLTEMDSELRAGLIHIISVAMMNGRLRPITSTAGQVEYFLLEMYGKVKEESGNSWITRPKREHWLCGTLRDRQGELRWLKYQAERRCWVCQKKRLLQDPVEPAKRKSTYLQAAAASPQIVKQGSPTKPGYLSVLGTTDFDSNGPASGQNVGVQVAWVNPSPRSVKIAPFPYNENFLASYFLLELPLAYQARQLVFSRT